jgi:HK97 family phage major capsid protein
MTHISHKRATWETRDDGTADPMTEVRSALDGLTATVEQRLTAIGTDMTELRSRMDRAETVARRPGAATEQRQDGEVETRAFGAFIRRGREAMGADEIRSLRVSDDTAGGYLAPDQFVTELLRNLVQFSPVRQVARVGDTASGAVLLPKRTGGMTASWVGETDDRPETNVTFGQNRYPVAELAAYVDVSNAMLEDSAFDVANELAFEFAEEFGKAEGSAFVTGNGVLKPIGFMDDAAGLSFTNSGNANLITADGLIDLYHALAPAYRANGVWMLNSNTLSAIRKLKDGNGNYLLATAGIAGAPATTLLGRPVIEAPDMPDVAAGSFPVVFGDVSQGYRIFDRIALSVLRDPFSQATKGMTRFHGRRRVAGGVAKADALRKLKIAA